MNGAKRGATGLLAGRVVAVTGAGQGIGRGIAEACARHGAAVALLERDADAAWAARAAIEGAGGRTFVAVLDVRDRALLERALVAADAALGGTDVLVNNVGGTFAADFVATRERGWDALIDLNLRTVLHGTQLVVPLLQARGGGSIINVVSIEGIRAAPGFAVYAACKAAVVGFTRTMALELAPANIRVNALAPDICLTDGIRAMTPPELLERHRWIVPLGRAAEPDDVAGPAVFLASDLARYVTGTVLHVDGGTQAAGGWYRDPDGDGWIVGPPPARGT